MSQAVLYERARERLSAGVGRLSLELRGEQVVLFVRDDALRTLCTCGEDECVHVADAVRWLVGDRALERDSKLRSSAPAPAPGAAVTRQGTAELASALDDVLLAVVRTGVAGAMGPSVRDTLSRVAERSPSPMPMGLARWVGRLEASFDAQDLGTVARLLDGAARFARDLRASEPTAEQLERCAAWLGAQAPVARPPWRLTDCTLVEVGREHITGLARRSIERRYLVNLATGEVFREERLASEDGSIGPCPRVLTVGLAEVDPGGFPRRVRLLQYAVSPELTSEHWSALEAASVRRVRAVGDAYVEALQTFPGVAEPFVLFAPAEISAAPMHEPRDEDGVWLPLARAENAALVDAVGRFGAGCEIAWLAGRVTDAGGTLMLRPVSMAVRGPDGAGLRLCRVA